MSRSRNSLVGSEVEEGALAGATLLLNMEKRVDRVDFGVACMCLVDMSARGSDFSLVGEGMIPMLMGSDSPLNQPDSTRFWYSFLTRSVLSPVRVGPEIRSSLVGNCCGGCSGETAKS